MAIKSGRVGVAPDQVDAYGRVVASDYLVDQLKEVLPSVEVEPLTVRENGIYGTPGTKAFNPVIVSVPIGISVDDIAEGTKPSGHITLSDTVTAVADRAFVNKPITAITALNVTKINDYGLQKCSLLTSVNMPNLNTVTNGVFQDDVSLTLVNLPNLKYLGMNAFSGCSMLPSISLPECRKFNSSYAFSRCTALQEAYFPKYALGEASNTASNQSLDICPNLSIVDFGFVNIISNGCFSGDTALETLILRKSSSIVTLNNVGAFNNTPFASSGTGGEIYVPSALIPTYETATNWSTLTITWKALEGSDYE